jgi:peptide/nickel transport system permease protein
VTRRLLGAVGSLAGAFLLVSSFLFLVPGDPVDLLLGEQATAVDRDQLRAAMGLDRPWYAQLWSFARDFVTFRLHTSVPPFREAVWPQIARALPQTAVLTGAALLVALCIAIPAGTAAAARRGKALDAGATAGAVAFAALPRFWLGPMLIVLFALRLKWLPVSGSGTLAQLVLPAVTLGLPLAGFLTRITRGAVADALAEDHVRTARAKGLTERAVVLKHALPGALVPLLTVLGLELGALLGGAVVTEKVFGWPGMGTLLVTGIERRDYNTVRAVVLVVTFIYIAVNALADAAVAAVDPRVRSSR